MPNDTPHRPPRAIAGHDELLRGLDELERLLRRPIYGKGEREAMGRALSGLSDLLVGHFAGEETSGLFNDLPRHVPTYAKPVNHLRSEHLDILRTLDRLKDQLIHATTTETFVSLTAGLRRLVVMLRYHEEKEERLLAHARFHGHGAYLTTSCASLGEENDADRIS